MITSIFGPPNKKKKSVGKRKVAIEYIGIAWGTGWIIVLLPAHERFRHFQLFTMDSLVYQAEILNMAPYSLKETCVSLDI